MTASTLKQALILSTLALAGNAAWADDMTRVDTVPVSTRSRADVQAELLKARNTGGLLSAGELATQRTTTAAMPQARQSPAQQAGSGATTLIRALYGAA